ncbi:MAG: MBL fold metallo-hydrolase [Candidatus Nealsonbacteria bacterium]|nr:MBL fold metallo-hydrolase [Candidatus Nealsonbacteria bacterium]
MQIKCLKVGPLETNCYFLISKKEIAIIDPGAEPFKIIKEIRSMEAKPKFIINTHYHPDHTLANKDIKKEFNFVKILIHGKERGFLDFKADVFLKENDEIKIGNEVLRVIHTPGHSQGSICLLGQGFILTGDTLFKEGYGRTDFEGGSQIELEESLKRLSKIIKPKMMIYPGHDEIFKFDNSVNFF